MIASALGCSSVTPPTPSASAVASGDLPAPTLTGAPRTPDPAAELDRRGPRDRPPVPAAPDLPGAYRFVSAPDFLNQDVADLTADGRKPYIVRKTGVVANSTNAEYDAALDHVISEMAAQGTDDVLVAGDLVEGRWGRDDARTGVFGPVRTGAQRMRAWRRAAEVYYPAYRQRFAGHGLRTLPAIGDHEIGDNPWSSRRPNPWIDFKQRRVPQFKQIYADQMLTRADGTRRFSDRPRRGPARDTAYAVRLDANVLLVSVDVFQRRGADVRMSLDPAQLAWLNGVLRRARKDRVPWVMVQGHTPMTGDVRSRNSSELVYEKGTRSDFWKAMVRGGVDVYLSGEVHDQTVRQRDGILEVSHGSLFYRGEASYVVGQATADQLVLENRQFRGIVGFEDRLWTTSRQGAPGHISYPYPSIVTGTLEASRTSSGGLRLDEADGVFTPRR
jgi:hypothetical protein